MALRDKVQKKPVSSEIVEVAGERYRVSNLGALAKSEALAEIRKHKQDIDCGLLSRYVSDPDDGSTLTYEEWTQVSEEIAGPLMSVVIKKAGLDKDDLKRDPKDSGTTES